MFGAETFARVIGILERAVGERAFPGAVCAVGQRDQLAILPVGRLTYAADSPRVTSDTIYDLASLTKVVASTTAAMILTERGVGRGRLALDNPVASYLPDFVQPYDEATDPLWSARSEITVRQLLAHTSGLPAYEKLFLQAREKSHVIEEALQLPLEAAPGSRTSYSDIGFILLGEILERVSKESLDAFCRREIFDPLGMRQTCFNPPIDSIKDWRERIAPTEMDESFRKRLIWGEVHDENAWVMGGVAGHAGLFATTGDLASFCRMMLGEGTYEDGEQTRRLVQAATIREFTRAWPADPARAAGEVHGLGWAKRSEPSSSGHFFSSGSYGHLGFTGTSIWIDPEKSLFVILLSNRVHPSRANEAIRAVRPALHDAVVECLGATKPSGL